MSERLFDLDEIPEVPLLREPRGRRGPARGVALDARFLNDYPPDWDRCQTCLGIGVFGETGTERCSDCLGMGSLKARVRLEAGHRCERCKHPYVPKGDAARLGVEPSWRSEGWSACDERCEHGGGPLRWRIRGQESWQEILREPASVAEFLDENCEVDAAWRILTVHHLDGDKANCRWWNLAALCQADHLSIQNRVVMERVYPHEHSSWFRPHAAGYYAKVYLGLDLTREEVEERMDELLALERG